MQHTTFIAVPAIALRAPLPQFRRVAIAFLTLLAVALIGCKKKPAAAAPAKKSKTPKSQDPQSDLF